MIPESEIPRCPELKSNQKQGKSLKSIIPLKKILESLEIDPYFDEHYEKEKQADKNRCQYILFRINIYCQILTEKLLKIKHNKILFNFTLQWSK